MKYSDQIAEWLLEMGYTTCFFVGGGGCMHLVESLSRKLNGIPVIHEVAAGIAAEYFNVVADGKEKAVALVTSGPGLTNIVTAVAGAWYESRELLVIGGQVKTGDMALGRVRQKGFFEACGTDILRPIACTSETLMSTVDRDAFAALVESGHAGRKGPVFIEVPLDIQAAPYEPPASEGPRASTPAPAWMTTSAADEAAIAEMIEALKSAERPVVLLGGGIERQVAFDLADRMAEAGIPVMTTFNGADRIDSRHPCYFGRTNWWGMRYSNILFQQADCAVALGTRLGIQQTGFNWEEYLPVGKLYQVDIDPAETSKGHPKLEKGINCDANLVLRRIYDAGITGPGEWLAFCREVKAALPLSEDCNHTGEGYVSPYDFYLQLSDLMTENDLFIPCSSGGSYTVSYQTFAQKKGQFYVTDKGMASMGYGLSGAIGAAVAGKGRRTVTVEGDGGFAQNIQELGTVAINRLNLKMFINANNGYASIRMTQSNYFGGHYVGCDSRTGLGLPDWEKLFDVWGIPSMRIGPGFADDPAFREAFESTGPFGFIVPIDPAQTYMPKISSRINPDGSMVSYPLHDMHPLLEGELRAKVMKYLPENA